jgi:membrane-associated phospholipid phosphatase
LSLRAAPEDVPDSGVDTQADGTRPAAARLAALSAVCLVSAAAIGWSVHTHAPGFDTWLHDFAMHHRGGGVVGLAQVITQGGSTLVVWPIIAIAAVTYPRSGARRQGTSRWGASRWGTSAMIAAGAGAAIGARLVLSLVVQRPRPPQLDWATQAGGFAFPSGHTNAATIGAGVLAWAVARHLPRGRARTAVWAAAVTYAGAVGLTRIWLGVHWPLDVVGGWLFGAGWLAGMAAVIKMIAARRAV